jgi:hypothetical protein
MEFTKVVTGAVISLGLCAAALQAAGCTMTKAGVTQAQADEDAFECRRQAHTMTRDAVADAYQDCMLGRGYR